MARTEDAVYTHDQCNGFAGACLWYDTLVLAVRTQPVVATVEEYTTVVVAVTVQIVVLYSARYLQINNLIIGDKLCLLEYTILGRGYKLEWVD